MIHNHHRRALLLAASLFSLAASEVVLAQTSDAPETTAPDSTPQGDIIVTGTRISGAKTSQALPVTVVSEEQIAATGAVSGDELFRSIPQMGGVSFNSSRGQVSSNFARGDIGSVDLRGLGVGNTLVLINGRRVVQHPSSQASNTLAPVTTYNTNAIPVYGVQRVEVLRDGAAALYGTDAVAGVVNTILRDDISGGGLTAQYGGAEGTGMREFSGSGYLGTDFAQGRGNISMLFNYVHRSALDSTDQDFTATSDHRFFKPFLGTIFEGSNSLDDTSTSSPWGNFTTLGGVPVFQGSTRLTTAGGSFSIQPTANGGCAAVLPNDICIDDGNRATTGADRNTRWDAQAYFPISIMPKLDRANVYATGHYDLTDNLTLFGEASYYYAKTRSVQSSVFTIGSIRMTVPASNYWNPFGPVTFADGSANPNRLPGIDAPAEGLPVTITNYIFNDAGPTIVNVENKQSRFLAGLRGEALGFDWESALLYSEASVRDSQDGISATALQQSLALSTPDAYNPFNGGNPNDPMGIDSTPSSQAALDSIRVKNVRRNKSTLAQWDFRASKSDLFALPAGNVGMAFGAEARRDTQYDNRDPRVDGTLTWTDTVTGINQPSELFGVSPTPDTKGGRTVLSAYAEFAVPIVSQDMDVPLVRSLELQLAGRYEHYSDFGSIAKPKVAAAWDLFDGLRLRGSWAQGFRAPNLEQTNATLVTRGNTRTDWIRCEADLRAGRISNFNQCSQRYVATERRAGNPDLKPETSETWTAGAVVQPPFMNTSRVRTTFTVDYWQVKQKGIVGVFGGGNAMISDYLARVQGSADPNVSRRPATADDIALFAGTGIDPVGTVQYVEDKYRNLEPQTVRGIDFGFNLSVRDTGIGDFSLGINAAYLLKYFRNVSPEVQALLDARSAGQIDVDTVIPEASDQIRQGGFPKWRGSTSLTWNLGQVTMGGFVDYTSSIMDTAITVSGQNLRLDSYTTANLYVQYAFKDGAMDGARVRVGARNLTNAHPPLNSSGFGYDGALYSPVPRYWYVNVSKEF
ncbi:TonB-dependent receptor plug domain-containing protein [Novosphingobium beihaiensis]|uniref:TonB-dependent receptor n=1 Tax=Novosphingobium beihaiensis TaxID=2930389 RepID=A0ABT0BL13_9SPHN|nr:TonB-dependent receptor [Novosphingobium beihaiensis]MCJ2185751.1 TonB-dependent receptor [Novosphingobium beihaiensis]